MSSSQKNRAQTHGQTEATSWSNGAGELPAVDGALPSEGAAGIDTDNAALKFTPLGFAIHLQPLRLVTSPEARQRALPPGETGC